MFAIWAADGQRCRLIYRSNSGCSLVMGGDVTYVSDGVYLTEGRGCQLTGHRDLVRDGIHWQGKNASIFQRLTCLGREFLKQPEG